MIKIRVLIVDDHQIVRDGIRTLLEADSAIEVVGEAADGAEAILRAEQTKPDVILMDVSMPIMNGRIATSHILKRAPRTKVLVLSTYKDDDFIREMVFAGASGYLLKQGCAEDLLKAIRAVCKGLT